MLGRSLDALCTFRNMYKNTFVMIPLLVCTYLYKNTSLVIIPMLVFIGFAL